MKKSQVAMEYIIIVGLVLVILVPIILLYARYSSETNYAVTASKAEVIANEIAKAANSVYFYGEDTQTSIEVDFPSGVESISFSGNEIVFSIRTDNGISEIAKVTEVQLTDLSGLGQIPLVPGRKKIIVKSLGDKVAVSVPCELGEKTCAPSGFPSCSSNECSLECQNYVWTLVQDCGFSCTGTPKVNRCSELSRSTCIEVKHCIWDFKNFECFGFMGSCKDQTSPDACTAIGCKSEGLVCNLATGQCA